MEEQTDEPTTAADLAIATHVDGDRAELSIRGELDAYTAPRVEAQVSRLFDNGIRRMTFVLSETTFIDSTGLRAILGAQRRLVPAGGELRLRQPSEAVVRLLSITGLDEHLEID